MNLIKNYENKKTWFDSNPKKTIGLILVILVILVVAVIEFLLSNMSDNTVIGEKRHIRLKEFNPNYSSVLRPDSKYLENTDSFEYKDYILRVDSNGFIKPSKLYNEPDKSIVFLGGSTTESVYVDEKNRFPYLVGRMLENKSGYKINSFNSGVSGNNSLHSLNILLNKIIPIKPNIVVLMHNINDISTLIHEGTYWNNNQFRSVIVSENKTNLFFRLQSIKNFLIPNLYAELKKFIDISRIVVDDEFYNSRNKKLFIDNKKIIKQFKVNLKLFIAICKESNITPVLMTQFNRIKESPDNLIKRIFKNIKTKQGMNYKDYARLYKSMNNAIADIADKNGIFLIDLDKEVPKTKEFIYDSVHLNNKGSIYVSKIISENIIKSNLLE